jgi:predicted anti-sigma-YlaC factor YlaD
LAINPPPEEAAAIRQSYRRRRAIMRGLLAVVLIAWLGFVGAMCFGTNTGDVGFGVWMGLVAVVGVSSFTVWRCPRCGAPLGRSLGVDRCPQCVVALEAAPKEPSRPAV